MYAVSYTVVGKRICGAAIDGFGGELAQVCKSWRPYWTLNSYSHVTIYTNVLETTAINILI